MNTCSDLADFGGRLLIAALFLVTGVGKVAAYAGTAAAMQAAGVPEDLLPAVIACEILGAFALIVGYRVRWAAAALAAFSVAAALLFHGAGDEMQRVQLLKNLAVAGGLLLLLARGAGGWSLDARRERLVSTVDPLALRA